MAIIAAKVNNGQAFNMRVKIMAKQRREKVKQLCNADLVFRNGTPVGSQALRLHDGKQTGSKTSKYYTIKTKRHANVINGTHTQSYKSQSTGATHTQQGHTCGPRTQAHTMQTTRLYNIML